MTMRLLTFSVGSSLSSCNLSVANADARYQVTIVCVRLARSASASAARISARKGLSVRLFFSVRTSAGTGLLAAVAHPLSVFSGTLKMLGYLG